jgi:HSP20 family molecular chaperone IbpA
MWAQALDLLDRADRMHRHFFQPGMRADATPATPSWEPPIDVLDDGRDLWILVALPGVEPSRMRVRFEGTTLVVAGERSLPERCRSAGIRRLEIPYGRFERRIPIPWADFELREERIEHGCLLIGLRRLS